MSNFDTEIIEEKIGYCFDDKPLLKLAFTHSSYANENKTASNEKLEFLGDSILNFCIAEHLFRMGGGDEGTLSVMRSKIVSETPLARCVDGLDIIGHLICGVGEERNNPHKSDAVKADLFEAIVGAIYLDSGDVSACERFITGHLERAISDALSGKAPLKYTFRISEKKAKIRLSTADADADDARLTAAKHPRRLIGRKGETREEKAETKRKRGKNAADAVKEPKEKKAKAKEKAGKPAAVKNNPEETGKNRPRDYKSALQNYLQGGKRAKPDYIVTGQSGSAHAPVFNVDVAIDGRVCGSGAGPRKKDAEQAAARQAYERLQEQGL